MPFFSIQIISPESSEVVKFHCVNIKKGPFVSSQQSLGSEVCGRTFVVMFSPMKNFYMFVDIRNFFLP